MVVLGNSFVELHDFGMTQETIQDNTGGSRVSPNTSSNPPAVYYSSLYWRLSSHIGARMTFQQILGGCCWEMLQTKAVKVNIKAINIKAINY
jgi:hypothetical protein